MTDETEMPIVLNPSAIGNPDEEPQVYAPWLAALACPGGEPVGWCGGLNGFHIEGCPVVS